MPRLLLVAPRERGSALASEYEDVLRATGLHRAELEHLVLDDVTKRLPPADVLSGFDGIIVGGSPLCVSTPVHDAWQRHVTRELRAVCDTGLPVLFICFGAGFVADAFGGTVGHTHPEVSGSTVVTLTEAGRGDPVFGTLPRQFHALTGHTENVVSLPSGVSLLATGPSCPVQALRVGERIWATQFHPDLDHAGMVSRMTAYRSHGYFPAESFDEIISELALVDTAPAQQVLRNFVGHAVHLSSGTAGQRQKCPGGVRLSGSRRAAGTMTGAVGPVKS